MRKFFPAHNQFWLNDQPQFIQAGEFHYFRTPHDQWHHRLDLLKAAGFNTLATYIPWLWHQPGEGESDFNGHSHPMRDLEGFLDLAADMGLYIIARPGPYIMAETINEGIPPWVFTKYPQVAFISQDSKKQNVVSYLHPDFLSCVKKWYKAIFEVLTPRQITRDGRIIMIQLDNEMGMIQWVRNIIDVNPHTITKFVDYMTAKYSDGLTKRYPVENLEDFITNGILQPKKSASKKIIEDYRHFYREYLREYASFLWAEAKENGMDVLPVINIHGFMNGGKTFAIGLSQLISVMRIEGIISATDVYPGHISEGDFHQLLMVNEMTKALQNKDQPLFSIEFQSGGHRDFSISQASLYDLHTRLCVSSGMRAINHYLFFGGVNDPILSPVRRHDWGPPVRMDGSLRKHFYRYPKLSSVLRSYGTDLIRSRPRIVTTIGFFLDHFMTEVNNKQTQETTRILTHQREEILFDMLAWGLTLTHRPFDAIELSSNDLDVVKIPLVWLMMEKQCDSGTQQKLANYVKNGGNLIIAGRMCVEEFNHKKCTILKDALGIKQIKGVSEFPEDCLRVFDYPEVPASFVETYTGEFDDEFAWRENGEIVGFFSHIGEGKVAMLGAAMCVETLEDINIVNLLAKKMECPPLFALSDWADVRISCGDNGSFLFLNNYQDDPVETTITYDQVLLFDGKPVSLPARRGLILPYEWKLDQDITFHYLTTEISEINKEAQNITVQLAQNEFFGEVALSGYHCDHSVRILKSGREGHIRMHGKKGKIVFLKDT